jgi:hypothetical protein
MAPTSLSLRVPPTWDAIPTAWDPCQAALRGAGLGEDETYSLCMVVQELLENAVKYGDWAAQPGDAVGLALCASRDEVTIEVKNPVGDDASSLRHFDLAVQWIRGHQDPFEAYIEKMKLVSAEDYGSGRSGLGLTRIAYEGRCLIDFYVDACSTLAVSAVYQRERRGGEAQA